MKDYDAIRNLIARYSHAAEAIDPDAYAAVFTENGSMTEYGETVTTRDRLRAMMAHGQSIRTKRGEFTEFYRHLQMNSLIRVRLWSDEFGNRIDQDCLPVLHVNHIAWPSEVME